MGDHIQEVAALPWCSYDPGWLKGLMLTWGQPMIKHTVSSAAELMVLDLKPVVLGSLHSRGLQAYIVHCFLCVSWTPHANSSPELDTDETSKGIGSMVHRPAHQSFK